MNNDKLICIRDEDDTKLTTRRLEDNSNLCIGYLLLGTLKETQ